MTHLLWRAGLKLPARLFSQIARWLTGVEIHPGASIGCRLFIDHGLGIVIGETAIIGNDVTLFQGVTLGGTGKERGKRHPTLLDGVYVGNNANVLGNITVGENSRVGAGSVVLRDVPPNSTVVGVPAHIIYREGKRVLITNPHEIKDPLSDSLIALSNRVEELETRLQCLDGKLHTAGVHDGFGFLTTEEKEQDEYSEELARLRHDYVEQGEGI